MELSALFEGCPVRNMIGNHACTHLIIADPESRHPHPHENWIMDLAELRSFPWLLSGKYAVSLDRGRIFPRGHGLS
jgi:hypothetical protein